MHTSIVASGIHTGSLETNDSIRSGVAFDLSAVSGGCRILSAHLRLWSATGAPVLLSDPAHHVDYGTCSPVEGGEVTIPLNTMALCDLRAARGAFFWMEATSPREAFAPDASDGPRCALDLTCAVL